VNIKTEIFEFLEEKGCTYYIQDGIVMVTTPEGKVWDFTEPMECVE